MTQAHQAFTTHLLRYVGIGLISGSIVHATTLGHDLWRTISFISLGILLFLTGLYLEHRGQFGRHLASYIVLSILVSLGTGMVSGSTQHYLDGPQSGALLFSIGGWMTYIALLYRDHKEALTKKSITLSFLIACIIGFALYTLGDSLHLTPHTH